MDSNTFFIASLDIAAPWQLAGCSFQAACPALEFQHAMLRSSQSRAPPGQRVGPGVVFKVGEVPLKTRQWNEFFKARAASGHGNVTPAARWVSDLFGKLENRWIITASNLKAAKAAGKEGQHET